MRSRHHFRSLPNRAPRSVSNGPTEWCCPVCTTSVPHPHRPGRARVYCSNACKQQAYRWRCRRRDLLQVTPPPERARTRDRVHALRSDADIVTSLGKPSSGPTALQRVTACGAFANAARDSAERFAHTKFYASAAWQNPNTPADGVCRSCVSLLDVPIESATTIFEHLGIDTGRRAA